MSIKWKHSFGGIFFYNFLPSIVQNNPYYRTLKVLSPPSRHEVNYCHYYLLHVLKGIKSEFISDILDPFNWITHLVLFSSKSSLLKLSPPRSSGSSILRIIRSVISGIFYKISCRVTKGQFLIPVYLAETFLPRRKEKTVKM